MTERQRKREERLEAIRARGGKYVNHVLETLDQNEPTQTSPVKTAKGFRAVDLIAEHSSAPKSEVTQKENTILRTESKILPTPMRKRSEFASEDQGCRVLPVTLKVVPETQPAPQETGEQPVAKPKKIPPPVAPRNKGIMKTATMETPAQKPSDLFSFDSLDDKPVAPPTTAKAPEAESTSVAAPSSSQEVVLQATVSPSHKNTSVQVQSISDTASFESSPSSTPAVTESEPQANETSSSEELLSQLSVPVGETVIKVAMQEEAVPISDKSQMSRGMSVSLESLLMSGTTASDSGEPQRRRVYAAAESVLAVAPAKPQRTVKRSATRAASTLYDSSDSLTSKSFKSTDDQTPRDSISTRSASYSVSMYSEVADPLFTAPMTPKTNLMSSIMRSMSKSMGDVYSTQNSTALTPSDKHKSMFVDEVATPIATPVKKNAIATPMTTPRLKASREATIHCTRQPADRELALQTKMHAGAEQILKLQTNTDQLIETCKVLAVSTLAITACKEALVRHEDASSHAETKPQPRSVSFQGISIPMKWVGLNLKEKYDFAFFLVLRVGYKVMSSDIVMVEGLESPSALQFWQTFALFVRINEATIVIICSDALEHDFSMHVQIYGGQVSRKDSRLTKKESSLTPRKLLNFLRHTAGEKHSKTPLAEGAHSHASSTFSNFKLVAEGLVDIYRVAEGETVLFMQESENFPLLSSVSFQSQTRVVTEASRHEGFLTFQGDELMFGKNAGPWIRRYAVFNGHALQYWQFPEHVGKRDPDGEIGLSTVTDDTIVRASMMECLRPDSFTIHLKKGEMETLVKVACDSKESANTWLSVLNQALYDTRAWAAGSSDV